MKWMIKHISSSRNFDIQWHSATMTDMDEKKTIHVLLSIRKYVVFADEPGRLHNEVTWLDERYVLASMKDKSPL